MVIQPSAFAARNVSALYASQGDRVTSTLRRSAEGLTREVDSARVQLSAFGRAQSAAENVQSSARMLQDKERLASLADVKKTAAAFVSAYNSERAALASVADRGSERVPVAAATAAASAGEGRAAIAAAQLQRGLGDVASSLRDAGLRVERDGSLAVDTKALESAFKANPTAVTQALGDVGRAAEVVATRQLAEKGSISEAVRNLEDRVERFETRQRSVENAAQGTNESAQRGLEAVSRRYGFGAVGAGAYLGIFGL